MKLVTFRWRGEETARIGAVDTRGRIVDLGSSYASYLNDEEGLASLPKANLSIPTNMAEFISGGQACWEAAETAIAYAEKKREEGKDVLSSSDKWAKAPEEVEFLPPILRPGKMICAGMNYKEHLSDSGSDAPEMPVAFSKFSSCLIGHKGDIVYNEKTPTLDYEIELAFVIGKKGKCIEKAKAADYIYGYTVFNDISERSLQFPEMKTGLLLGGKNMDTFGPIGPWIVTRDEIKDPHNLRMVLKVNGEVRQDSNTKHMIFDIYDQIAYWSNLMTLYPGDVFATGTASGVACGRRPNPQPYYLKPGDIIEAQIEGIGTLTNRVIREEKRNS